MSDVLHINNFAARPLVIQPARLMPPHVHEHGLISAVLHGIHNGHLIHGVATGGGHTVTHNETPV